MARREIEQPKEFYGYPDYIRYLELYDETGDVKAVVGLDWCTVPQGVQLHIEIKPGKWGPKAARFLKHELDWLEREARMRGCKAICACTSNVHDAERWFKFTDMYGFEDQRHLLFAWRYIEEA